MDPADCKCECHIPYDPTSLTETFISHYGGWCCGSEAKGSKVEMLPAPEFSDEEIDAYLSSDEHLAYFKMKLLRALKISDNKPE